MVQITIACVTLYLHRSQAHRAVQFHSAIAHFMRFWLWLTTGMITKEWVAIHRKHHQFSDKDGDPHSPTVFGLWTVIFKGAWLYKKAGFDKEMVERLGVGTPSDRIEQKLYTPHPYAGLLLMMVINLLLFGWAGLLVWGIQMSWIPFWAAGIVNGAGHKWGYRNYNVKDTSTNLWPLGIWIGGEELHNNHHGEGASAKFSRKWWEFDIGWMYIKIFKFFKLAKVR